MSKFILSLSIKRPFLGRKQSDTSDRKRLSAQSAYVLKMKLMIFLLKKIEIEWKFFHRCWSQFHKSSAPLLLASPSEANPIYEQIQAFAFSCASCSLCSKFQSCFFDELSTKVSMNLIEFIQEDEWCWRAILFSSSMFAFDGNDKVLVILSDGGCSRKMARKIRTL